MGLSQPWIRSGALLAGMILIFHLFGIGVLPLVDRDEPSFAEASREMIERGDYVVPHFNGAYRFDKPPLFYWLQTAAFRVLGSTETAARLPSALAAAGVALILCWWGASLGFPKVGQQAALLFSTSLAVWIHAKAGVADMTALFFITLSFAAGSIWLVSEKNQTALKWIFYISMALGFLAKGPIAFFPLLAICFFQKREQAEKKEKLFCWKGILVLLGIVALWGIPALWETQGEYFKVGIGEHVVQRSLIPREGHGGTSLFWYVLTLPFYFFTVWISFFPWSPFMAITLWAKWKNRNCDSVETYLAWGIGLVFLIFSLIRTKLPHYILPAFPLLAFGLAWQWRKREDHVRWMTAGLLLMIGLDVAGAVLGARLSHQSAIASLIHEAAPQIQETTAFASTVREPSVVWYSREYTRSLCRWIRPDEIEANLNRPGSQACLVREDEMAGLAVGANWKVFRKDGLNSGELKPVHLALIIKPE